VKVRFTPSGREQFLQVIGYILQDNRAAGSAFRRRAERVLRRLGKFPESGRLVPEFPELPFREVIVSPYRFFYRVKGRTVWVVAVWHSAQLAGEPGESNDL
jgi:toxin ParE1/3/4